jgi:NAD(P)-dependent dehydrogenase (short-subunit alcohol dehydrogenase family)
MLALMALERHGLMPKVGPAIVTGTAGGVGSIAIALLSKAGWHVIAATGRPQEADYLKSFGAAEVVARAELASPAKPLAKLSASGATGLSSCRLMVRGRYVRTFAGPLGELALRMGAKQTIRITRQTTPRPSGSQNALYRRSDRN